MRQHVGVFTANFSSNLLWQNCFAPKKSAFCAEPRRTAAGILDVCQGGAATRLRQTRLLRRMFSYARWPKRPAFVCGEGCRSREGQKPLPHGKRRIPAPVTRGGQRRPPLQTWNDSAARWERRDTWVPPYGVRRSSRADRVVRPYKAKQEPCKTGRRGRRPLRWGTRTVRSGTAGTACPTHSVIARSEATRQSVLPSPKRRIPAPVCTPRALASRRALARNDSAPRWERRDTWVPPYGVRRSSRAGRDIRPYKAEQEPCEAGRRGRRPLHTLSLRGAKRCGNPFSPARKDGFPRQ